MLITFVVAAKARTTKELFKTSPGTTKTKPLSGVTVNSIFSAVVVPPNSIVSFTDAVEELTA